MNLCDYFNTPVFTRLAWALGHFLWQGLAIAALAFLAVNAFGRGSSRVRYGLYMTSLFSMVVVLAATFMVVEGPSRSSAGEVASERAGGRVDFGLGEVEGEIALPVEREGQGAAIGEAAVVWPVPSPVVPEKASFFSKWHRYLPYAMCCYFLGVVAMLNRLLLGLQGGQRLRRLSDPVNDPAILATLARQARALGLSLVPPIAYCQRVMVPTVVGILKPMILLPVSFGTVLSSDQVEMLLAHELAHISRYDPIFNVMQRLIEVLLFFHPAVWFISRRIRLERESCCDDLVLKAGGTATDYASSLVEVAHQALPASLKHRRATAGLCAVDGPSQLRLRILRLLGSKGHEQVRLRHSWIILLAFTAIIGAGIVTGEPKDAVIPANLEKELVSTETRVIHFPADGSMGTVHVGELWTMDPLWWQGWEAVAEARGDVQVPIGKDVRLEISAEGSKDISPLASLEPDDIQAMNFFDGRGARTLTMQT